VNNNKLTWIILIGTFIAGVVFNALLLYSYLALNNSYVINRIPFGLGLLGYLLTAYFFAKKNLYNVSNWMLIILYGFLSASILMIWGINAPVGVLMLGFVILLAGILNGRKFIIPTAISTCVLMTIIFLIHNSGHYKPDNTSLSLDANIGDLATFCTLFGIFTLIAWLSVKQNDESFSRALIAEKELALEKAQLAARLKERSQQLREIILKDVRQVYHFAELGQTTTVLLHELSNALSILKLDLDSLTSRNDDNSVIFEVKKTIYDLEQLIEDVRNQINVTSDDGEFYISSVLRKCVESFDAKIKKLNIEIALEVSDEKDRVIRGSAPRLAQVINVLIRNSVDALDKTNVTGKKIVINYVQNNFSSIIRISDNGPGINTKVQKSLFKPHKSSKAYGLGIGLYVAREIVKSHFSGKLSYDSTVQRGASFIIKI
jgi:signal transduction histidine kinase